MYVDGDFLECKVQHINRHISTYSTDMIGMLGMSKDVGDVLMKKRFFYAFYACDFFT